MGTLTIIFMILASLLALAFMGYVVTDVVGEIRERSRSRQNAKASVEIPAPKFEDDEKPVATPASDKDAEVKE